MSTKWVALTAGVLTSGALLYSFQHDIDNTTDHVRNKLYNSKNKLEASLPENLRDKVSYINYNSLLRMKNTYTYTCIHCIFHKINQDNFK